MTTFQWINSIPIGSKVHISKSYLLGINYDVSSRNYNIWSRNHYIFLLWTMNFHSNSIIYPGANAAGLFMQSRKSNERFAHRFLICHWNGNVFILMKFSSLAALEVVKMTTSSAASD